MRSSTTSARLLLPAALSAAALVLAACASGGARDVGVRAAPATNSVSCSEWVRRAVAAPELDVERVPEPIAYDPPPIPRRLPRGVVGRDGRAEVRIKVLVDTLGRADMRSFRVVRSTHPKLTASVRHAVSRWRFRPAEIGGCKVPRVFNWGAVAGG
jgi:hypothetical protein